MPEEFGTKDVLEQVDARLGNVEQDIRQMSGRLERLEDRINTRFDQQNARFDQQSRWLIGLIVVTWLSVMMSIWLKP